MLDVPMDVETVFNMYKITYVCTHSYNSPTEEGVTGHCFLVTGNEASVRHWFREAFNCHGDIHDLISIELLNPVPAQIAFDHYMYVAEQREA